MTQCPECRAQTPAGARFCPSCGGSLPTAVDPAGAFEERRLVTAVFCDLVDSTALASAVDPELLHIMMLRYYELMHEQIKRNDGVVEKFIGDAVVAIFGLELSRHDDARRALRASLGMVAASSQLGRLPGGGGAQPLAVRIGVHTGEVVTARGGAHRLVSGDVVSVAARLQAAAAPGTVLISAQTRTAAGAGVESGPGVMLRLKGLPGPREALPLIRLREPELVLERGFDGRFVGRARELAVLDRALQDATAGDRPGVVVVGGEAGVGKSRLVAEWLTRHAGAAAPAVIACCGSRSENASLAPLVPGVGKLVAGAEPSAAVRLLRAGLLFDGTPSPSAPETAAALAEVLARRAYDGVPAIVIDDFHHSQEPLRATLGHLIKVLAESGTRLLCLCLARTEQPRETRTWAELMSAAHVHVANLSRAEAEEVAAGLGDATAHGTDLARKLVERGGGNPLYLEQLAGLLAQDPHAAFEIPLGLHGLLAERIDKLEAGERLVLRTASVIDMEFDRETLAGLLAGTLDEETSAPSASPDDLLRGLVRHRLIEASPADGSRETGRYRFVNAVIQRAAYEGLAKRRRAELHERLGNAPGPSQSTDALAGHHLMWAHRFRIEIGLADEHSAALARQAGTRLAAAGSEALRRVDLARAEMLLREALELTDHRDGARARRLQQHGEAQLLLGRLTECFDTFRAAAAAAQQAGLPEVAAHARLHLHLEQGDASARERAARESIAVFTASGDALGLARSSLILAESALRRGRHAEAERELHPAVRHAAAARADRELANTLGAWGLVLWHGPTPARRAVVRCEELLRRHGADRLAVTATLGFSLTMLHAILGDSPRAYECMRATDEAMRVLGHADGRVFGPYLSALVQLESAAPLEPERAARAFADLESARAAALDLRAGSLASTVALDLARLALDLGDEATARREIERAQADPKHPVLYAARSGLRARIMAQSAESGSDAAVAAVTLVREALLVSRTTDSPAVRARALQNAAAVYAAVGRRRDAEAAARRAGALFAVKGHKAAGRSLAAAAIAGLPTVKRGGR